MVVAISVSRGVCAVAQNSFILDVDCFNRRVCIYVFHSNLIYDRTIKCGGLSCLSRFYFHTFDYAFAIYAFIPIHSVIYEIIFSFPQYDRSSFILGVRSSVLVICLLELIFS